ncbi:MAG TPA: hypothetical protein VFM43_06595 [Gaiellaceae bacterium]|nr:hypothetical protein [Gaiellaceae bacterium]
MIPIRRLSRRRKTTVLVAIMSFVALVAVGVAQAIGSASTPLAVRTVTVQRAVGRPPGLFVASGRVEGARNSTLAAKASSPLSGWIAPVAVPTADGGQLVYSTWRELRHDDPKLSWSKQGIKPGDALATPMLRIHDFRSGRDKVVDKNSFSAAVRSDGTLAYVRGTDVYRAFTNYTGDVVVRSSLSTRPVVWSTEPAEYVVAAWAGSTLLAYRIAEGEKLDVLAFDGPGRQRLLMADSNLVAVSPDGTQALLANEAGMPGSISVVNVADGTIAATLDLGPLNQGILWAAYGGSWSDDLVAAPTNVGIAVFGISAGSISLEELLKNDPGTFANGLIEPQFSGDTKHIVARGDAAPDPNAGSDEGSTAALECDLTSATCLARTTEPGSAWLHPAYNPSRPSRGGSS